VTRSAARVARRHTALPTTPGHFLVVGRVSVSLHQADAIPPDAVARVEAYAPSALMTAEDVAQL